MKRRWSKDRTARIRQLNEILQMAHRTKPYDIKNPDDLKEMVCYASGHLLDIFHYGGEIDILLENYDETIETFYPAEWLAMGQGELDGQDIEIPADIWAYRFLHDVQRHLDEAFKQQLDECRDAWTVFLANANPEIIEEMTGGPMEITEVLIERVNDLDFHQLALEIDPWPYSVEESGAALGRAIRQVLEG